MIGTYYHDPAFVAQAGTITQPDSIAIPEEIARGVVFVLVLLPILAVMRGRDWRSLLALGVYVALMNAVLEAWLTMLGNSSAIVRGVFVPLLLALPAVAVPRHAEAPSP